MKRITYERRNFVQIAPDLGMGCTNVRLDGRRAFAAIVAEPRLGEMAEGFEGRFQARALADAACPASERFGRPCGRPDPAPR